MNDQSIVIELKLAADVASLVTKNSELLGVSVNQYINMLIISAILTKGAETVVVSEEEFAKLMAIGEKLSPISPALRSASDELDKKGF